MTDERETSSPPATRLSSIRRSPGGRADGNSQDVFNRRELLSDSVNMYPMGEGFVKGSRRSTGLAD